MKIKVGIYLMFIIITLITFSFKTKNKIMSSENQDLNYLIRTPQDLSKKAPLLVLLHGYGGNENDLFSLSNSVPNNWIVVSVSGPYQIAENSYRWYDVKMKGGKITINIEQEEVSRKMLLKLINDLTKKFNIDNSKIVIAGFSQGANMAQALGLSEPKLISGFGVFSGRYIEEFTQFINNSSVLKNSKAFISYGSSDNMLPKSYVNEHVTKLNDLGIQITYYEDTNGHSISIKQWNEFSKWLLNFK